MHKTVAIVLGLASCSRTEAQAPSGALQERPGKVAWWIQFSNDSGGPEERQISGEKGEIPVPTSVSGTRCTYDAVETDANKEARWVRCVAETWYSSTLAACSKTSLVVRATLSNDELDRVADQRDHSMMLLRGADQHQFGIGLRCETTAK
jgi:hypothetical protein